MGQSCCVPVNKISSEKSLNDANNIQINITVQNFQKMQGCPTSLGSNPDYDLRINKFISVSDLPKVLISDNKLIEVDLPFDNTNIYLYWKWVKNIGHSEFDIKDIKEAFTK